MEKRLNVWVTPEIDAFIERISDIDIGNRMNRSKIVRVLLVYGIYFVLRGDELKKLPNSGQQVAMLEKIRAFGESEDASDKAFCWQDWFEQFSLNLDAVFATKHKGSIPFLVVVTACLSGSILAIVTCVLKLCS